MGKKLPSTAFTSLINALEDCPSSIKPYPWQANKITPQYFTLTKENRVKSNS